MFLINELSVREVPLAPKTIKRPRTLKRKSEVGAGAGHPRELREGGLPEPPGRGVVPLLPHRRELVGRAADCGPSPPAKQPRPDNLKSLK